MIYQTSGTCAVAIEFEVENDTIKSCEFYGGCNGNPQGVARLVTGRNIDEVIDTLEGIPCGNRPTSCPDQLARALKAYKQEQAGA